jgi:hypothetical protein
MSKSGWSNATVGNEQGNPKENDGDHNCLNGKELDNESDSLSVDVTEKKQLRPAGFEPATFGLGNRCSILLSYGRKSHHRRGLRLL